MPGLDGASIAPARWDPGPGHPRLYADTIEAWLAELSPGHDVDHDVGRMVRLSAFRRVVVLGVFGLFAGEHLFGDDAGILPDRRFDFVRNVGIGLEEGFGVLAALADA